MTSDAPREESRTAGHAVDRRTVIQGAAWSVPVIAAAVATPLAGAAVSCTPQAAVLDWQTMYTRTDLDHGTAIVPLPDGTSVTVQITSTLGSRLQHSTEQQGGMNVNQWGLNVINTPTIAYTSTTFNAAYTQTLVFQFDRDVEGISFIVDDIDAMITPSAVISRLERVWVSAPTGTIAPGSALAFDTSGRVWSSGYGEQATGGNVFDDPNPDDPAFQALVSIPGPTNAFTFNLNHTGAVNHSGVDIRNVSFTTSC